jgi:hypothetical protein
VKVKTTITKKNPLLQQKYNEGFTAGYDQGFAQAKRAAAAQFAVRLERLEMVSGIGEKTMEKIMESMQKDLTVGEEQAAERYMADLLEREWSGK